MKAEGRRVGSEFRTTRGCDVEVPPTKLSPGPRNQPPGQLSLAIPSWVGAMSTSQRAVTPWGWWGAKAGMVGVWVAGKTVWSRWYTLSALEIKGFV